MRVLVTGASGFIGRPLTQRLLAVGHEVRALVRRAEETALLPGATFAVGDVRDPGAVDTALLGMEAVVHLACATGVAREHVAQAVNVEGTRLVLDAAARHGARRFVFVSSISAVRERMGPYGRTKREAEALIAQSALDWVVFRPSLVYGTDEAGLFARLARSVRALPVLPVIGDGSMPLDPIHVDDVVEILAQALVRNDVVGRTYDLLGPERLTFDQLLLRIAAREGVPARLVHLPASLVLPLARALGAFLERPPLTVDNVLGMISPAQVDGGPARRDFPIRWTGLAAGLAAHRAA